MRTIIAKFASTCPCCSRLIAVGSKVDWEAGTKATHVSCRTARSNNPTRVAVSQHRPHNRGLSIARRNYEQTGDYYGSGLYDEES